MANDDHQETHRLAALLRARIEGADAEEELLRFVADCVQARSDRDVVRSAWERLDARLGAVDAALRRASSDYPRGDLVVDCVRDLVAGFDVLRVTLGRQDADRAELTRRLDALREQAEALGPGVLV